MAQWPRTVLAQHPDDPLFAEPAALHLRYLSSGPDFSSPWRRNKGSRHLPSACHDLFFRHSSAEGRVSRSLRGLGPVHVIADELL
jgi:hypothetical protein